MANRVQTVFRVALLAAVFVVLGARGEVSPAPRRAVPLTWCSLGTSITWYNDHVSSAFTKGYQTRVMERIHFDGFLNRGVNAGRVSSAIGQVVPAGLYTIEHGINDWGGRTPPGTMDDYRNDTGTGTFAGAYRKLVDAIRAANPNAAVILCTPRKGYGFGDYLPARCDAQQPNGYFLKDYADLVRDIAAYEKFPLADFFATCGEQDELASLSIDVALHPNDAGYQRMADELVRVLLLRFPNAPLLSNDDGELHGDAEMLPIPDDPELTPGALLYRKYLRPESRLVLKGVDLAAVEPVYGEMAGRWIPGSPYEASVHHIRRNAKKKTLVCQFQVRPPDNCLRCVAVEFRQHGPDVTAKILWARYIMNGPEPGVDFDAPSFGGAPIATSPESLGYGIGTIEFQKGRNPEIPKPEIQNPNAEARAALLDGVASLDVPGGIPGPIVCIGPRAFPLALGHLGSGGGEWCAIAAAAFAGKGRVVYLGHPAFLDSVAGGEDNRRLLQNAIRWLAKGTDSPKLANLGRPAAGELARSLGFDCTDAPVSLDGFDIVLCNDLTDAKVEPLRDFVERGGGLLAAGLGWGWRYYQPEKQMASLAARFPDNRLLAPMGLVMGGGYAHRNPDGRYPAPDDNPKGLTADEALDVLSTDGFVRLSTRRCAEKTLLSLAEALPVGAQPDCEARLDALLASPAAQGVPSPDSRTIPMAAGSAPPE